MKTLAKLFSLSPSLLDSISAPLACSTDGCERPQTGSHILGGEGVLFGTFPYSDVLTVYYLSKTSYDTDVGHEIVSPY